MEMRKIMVVGAGRGQVGLIKAAKDLGYSTAVVSIPGNYPGFELADEVFHIDIKDPEAVAEKAKEIGIDGIVTACMDAGLSAVGQTCDEMGLCGISRKVAEISANKLLMKDKFIEEGVQTAAYVKVSNKDSLVKETDKLNMPLITKAVDLGGSRGINVVLEEDELADCFRRTMEATSKDYCIVEEYIDGYECSATAMMADGEILFVLPTGDVRYGENEEFPIGHYVPFESDGDIDRQIVEQVALAAKAIGLDNCAVNADLMIKDGKVYIIELTGRLGANCIPELTSTYYGVDIHKVIVETAVGNFESVRELVKDMTDKIPCLGQMIISETDGLLESMELPDSSEENIVQIWPFVKAGEQIHKYANPKDCLGQIVVKGKSVEECRTAMDKVMKKISTVLK